MGTGHPALHRLIAQRLDASAPTRAFAPPFRDQVRTVLGSSLASGAVRLRDVAASLNVSERTMHRRLANEGTTFRTLLEEVRQQRALALLERR
jgi:AraC-like DNA-binding protein